MVRVRWGYNRTDEAWRPAWQRVSGGRRGGGCRQVQQQDYEALRKIQDGTTVRRGVEDGTQLQQRGRVVAVRV